MTVVDGEAFDSDAGRLLYNIQEVVRDDAGIYRCVANNGIGSSMSEELSLTVLCKLIYDNKPLATAFSCGLHTSFNLIT